MELFNQIKFVNNDLVITLLSDDTEYTLIKKLLRESPDLFGDVSLINVESLSGSNIERIEESLEENKDNFIFVNLELKDGLSNKDLSLLLKEYDRFKLKYPDVYRVITIKHTQLYTYLDYLHEHTLVLLNNEKLELEM